MNKPEERFISPFDHVVSVERRQEKFGHIGGVFWLTGLSGAGKSTLAMNVESSLVEQVTSLYNIGWGQCPSWA